MIFHVYPARIGPGFGHIGFFKRGSPRQRHGRLRPGGFGVSPSNLVYADLGEKQPQEI